jgi:hypothetical protein
VQTITVDGLEARASMLKANLSASRWRSSDSSGTGNFHYRSCPGHSYCRRPRAVGSSTRYRFGSSCAIGRMGRNVHRREYSSRHRFV